MMEFDAMLCFMLPRLARWTVVVVDRFDGQEYPMSSVRFRWRRHAERWIRNILERLGPPFPGLLEQPPRLEARQLGKI